MEEVGIILETILIRAGIAEKVQANERDKLKLANGVKFEL